MPIEKLFDTVEANFKKVFGEYPTSGGSLGAISLGSIACSCLNNDNNKVLDLVDGYEALHQPRIGQHIIKSVQWGKEL